MLRIDFPKIPQYVTEKKLVAAAVILAVLCFVFFKAEHFASEKLRLLRRDYQLDLALGKRGEEIRTGYEKILASRSMPTSSMLEQNDWIQKTQALAASSGLLLKQLTPLTGASASASQTQLSLALSGNALSLLQFLYAVSENGGWDFIETLKVSRLENSELLETDIVLAQKI